MRILHTIPGLSTSSGGPSTCTYYLLKGLQQLGVNADVLTIGNNQPHDRIIGNDGFIKAVPNDAKTPLVYSRNFRNYLAKNQTYDLYHANAIWTDPTHATLQCAQKQHKPCVIAPHGMLYPQALKIASWKKKIVLTLFQRKDLERATCLQATCMQEMQHIRNFGLTNPIAVVPNCLPVEGTSTDTRPENSVKRFGFVGRLHRIKNIDGLLKAWQQSGNVEKDAALVIVGSGDPVYETELRQYVSQHQLKNVSFAGFLTGDALQELVESLDFLILPSHSENFGMVVPEALMMGIPVIASKYTPWEELNTYQCGWWVANDVDTLAATIKKALEMPESERIKMGENGKKLVRENYSVEVVSQKMKRLYEWIINGGEKPEFVYQ